MKKIDFKKSWSYLLILGILFTVLLMFLIGSDLVPVDEYDKVLGTIYGVDITLKMVLFLLSFANAYCLLLWVLITVVKWCAKHITWL